MAFYVSYEGTLRSRLAEIDAAMEKEIANVNTRAEAEIELIRQKADEARWEAALEEAAQIGQAGGLNK